MIGTADVGAMRVPGGGSPNRRERIAQVARYCAVVFGLELATMLALGWLRPALPAWGEALTDATLAAVVAGLAWRVLLHRPRDARLRHPVLADRLGTWVVGAAALAAEFVIHSLVVGTSAPPLVRAFVDAAVLTAVCAPLGGWLRWIGDSEASTLDADAGASRRPHRVVWFGLLGAFSLVGVLGGLSAASALRDVGALAPYDDIVSLVGRQRTLAERSARLAALVEHGPAQLRAARIDELAGTIAQLGAERRRLEEVASGLARRGVPDRAGAQTLLADAGERVGALLHDGRVLLLAWGPSGDAAHRAEAGIALQVAADRAAPVLEQAEQAWLAATSAERAALGVNALFGGLVLLLALVASLGLAAPVARIVRNQHRGLVERTRELGRLTLVARNTHNPVLICDVRRRIVWANQAFEMVSGYRIDEVIGKAPGSLLQCADTDPAAVARLREALDAGRGVRVEILNQRRDGRRFWVDLDIRPIHGDDGGLEGFIAVETDVTEQVRSRRQMEALFRGAAAGIVVQAVGGRIVDCNAEAERLLGLQREQMLGRRSIDPRWRAIREDGSDFPGDQHPAMVTLRTGEPVRGVVMGIETPDGVRRWLHVNSQLVGATDDAERMVVSSFTDLTARRQMERQLQSAACLDKLTGLANRALLIERLERSIERALGDLQRGFAVLFLDFDRFKLVNDSLGHEAGDRLLQAIAQRLRQSLRAGDVFDDSPDGNLVARLGGDEFVVLLNDVSQVEQAMRIAERLMEALAPAYSIAGHEIHSSASIGIVTSEQCRESADMVLRNADTAMYEAKRTGRGRAVVFDEAMHRRLARNLTVEGALRKALGAQQFSLVYQPIVDLESGAMTAVEALVRWHHPELGEVSPSEFIPIAEETGLIVGIGEWVLRQACRQFVAWSDAEPSLAPTTVSVNLSRVQINLDGQIAATIRKVLEETGIEPSCLQLELTEREVLQNPEAARSMLDGLRALKVKVAMDDFGTGTSSLGCLREYPFDVVKIDSSFVENLEASPDVLAVIHATLTLIDNLGLTSVAEGVTKPEQVAILQAMGCRFGQGYLFSRPVPPEDVLRFARQPAGMH